MCLSSLSPYPGLTAGVFFHLHLHYQANDQLNGSIVVVDITQVRIPLLPAIQKLRTSGLTFSELETLAYLQGNPGVSHRDVEANASVTTSKQNISQTIGKLEKKGLILKKQKEWASTIRELYLTEDAECLLKELEAVLVDSLELDW